ncbi:hypothetical protein F4775DRAFT_164471 [Biscogniauxia sp. FL1348]|nr:hypothetical protein F4775DRAFT_164471 [Biscogniauxia sp. FL1348]
MSHEVKLRQYANCQNVGSQRGKKTSEMKTLRPQLFSQMDFCWILSISVLANASRCARSRRQLASARKPAFPFPQPTTLPQSHRLSAGLPSTTSFLRLSFQISTLRTDQIPTRCQSEKEDGHLTQRKVDNSRLFGTNHEQCHTHRKIYPYPTFLDDALLGYFPDVIKHLKKHQEWRGILRKYIYNRCKDNQKCYMPPLGLISRHQVGQGRSPPVYIH